MQKYERIGLWIIVAGLLIFGMTINSGLGSLQKTVNANSDKLAKSEVVASVIPGIPSALSDAWKAAAGTEDMSRADDLWLTVRLANRGYDLVGEVSAELSLVPEIADRSEEHTSELPSLMRISYAVFCLEIKKL